ncbi:hypothetical protein MAR_031969 [Mya arenaria]|uniref:Uncharacterized protein n=1 Tax=Mya arenaria TaxID=6604 RepID=A0ABY7F5B4_MYAAR|nr:hypothetical protein MAR_031969 [Mya arenaria]
MDVSSLATSKEILKVHAAFVDSPPCKETHWSIRTRQQTHEVRSFIARIFQTGTKSQLKNV